MKTRLVVIAGALSLCLAVPAIHAQPKVKAKDVPTPKDRCLLNCDAKFRQCLIDGTQEATCKADQIACRENCDNAPSTDPNTE